MNTTPRVKIIQSEEDYHVIMDIVRKKLEPLESLGAILDRSNSQNMELVMLGEIVSTLHRGIYEEITDEFWNRIHREPKKKVKTELGLKVDIAQEAFEAALDERHQAEKMGGES